MSTWPSEPVWLTIEDILESHEEQLQLFGGSPGIRDLGLIESALARPQQLFHYHGEYDVLTLAVRLGVGLAKNHGFVDGNKRAGAVAMIEFLMLNGYAFELPNDIRLGKLFEATVTGAANEEQLIDELFCYIVANDR